MKKKLTALFLSLLLALSLLASALAAPLPPEKPDEPEPDPTPIVTLQPEEPGDPGIAPQYVDEPPEEATKGNTT